MPRSGSCAVRGGGQTIHPCWHHLIEGGSRKECLLPVRVLPAGKVYYTNSAQGIVPYRTDLPSVPAEGRQYQFGL